MIYFRSCSRCEGDLYVERDLGEEELVCLQCGRRKTIPATNSRAGDDRTSVTRGRRLRLRPAVATVR